MAEEETEAESAPKKGGGSLLWIAIAAGASVLSAGGTFFLVSGKVDSDPPAAEQSEGGSEDASESADGGEKASSHGSEKAAKKSAATGDGAELSNIFELETFVVNINDGNRDRFLKIKPELEISELAVADELKARMPQVKDIVISLLSSQSFGQIRSIEGKDHLREEMLIRLNALVKDGKVIRVFFTEFVVQ